MSRRPTSHRLLLLVVVLGLSLIAGFSQIHADAGIPEHIPLILNGPQTRVTPAPQHPGAPLTQTQSADFSGSGNCAQCHSDLTDTTGQDVSIDTHWRASMMANSARDPLWQAKVRVEIQRAPALQATIEGKCAICHMPMARTQAAANGMAVRIFGDGFLNSNHPYHDLAMDGVSCTLCHQIQDANLGKPASFSGNFTIDTITTSPNRLIFGPYPSPLQQPMRNWVGFTPVYGPHIESSELCATCHTLYSPYLDEKGNVAGTFPEQTAYLEWKHSTFGNGTTNETDCQDCHMPVAAGPVIIANRPRRLSPRFPFQRHTFVGGNVFMLNLLRANMESLGLTASSDDFASAVQRTKTFLQQNTAHLHIQEARRTGETLEIHVLVQNMAGHKLPTGFPSRRMWIHLRVGDATGRPVFESGRPLPDGFIVGNDADATPGSYEPHYDLITRPDQVQIYEAIMGDTTGAVTYTLLRGAGYLKDNRLLPQGFDKATAHADIAVYGNASTDTTFVGGQDTVTYRIPVVGYTPPFTVTADLLFQSVSYQFVRDLVRTPTSEVTRFLSFYNQVDNVPVRVSGDEVQVP